MKNFIGKILGGGFQSITDGVGKLIDKFHMGGTKKAEFMVAFENLLTDRGIEIEETIRTELNAKMNVIMAELNQDDNFTKRARPSVIYTGLGVVVFNGVVVPILNWFIDVLLIVTKATATIPDVPTANVPGEFWAGWTVVVGIYSIGRSAEKRGMKAKSDVGRMIQETITGKKFHMGAIE